MAGDGQGKHGMSDIFGGIGSAVEGGLWSRAIEPESGAKNAHPDQPENCLNCGAELTGAFCQACGQKGHLHRTIGAFVHDLLHGALHLEGKLWRTLPMLVFRPGKLTRRYIDGERARFVSPMALFLFSVFLMFAVFQVIGITAPTNIPAEVAVEDTIDQARGAATQELDDLETQLANPDLDAETREELEGQQVALETILAGSESYTAPWGEFAEGVQAGTSDIEEASAVVPSEAGEEIVSADLNEDGTASMSVDSSGVEWIDETLQKWRDNPSLMLYKLQANAYKFSWLLIPISIPFVWLLFAWKRRFKAYDHAIFVTYSLSFVTLLFVIASIIGKLGMPMVVLPVLLIPPIHLYKQLRHTYDLSRFSAFWRLIVLSGFIWVIAGLFIQTLLLLGAF